MFCLKPVSGECPHIRRKWAGDEFIDYCELVDKPCVLLGSDVCDIWEEIKMEEE